MTSDKDIAPKEIESFRMAGLAGRIYKAGCKTLRNQKNGLRQVGSFKDENFWPIDTLNAVVFTVKRNATGPMKPSYLELLVKVIAEESTLVCHMEELIACQVLLFFPLAYSSDKNESKIGIAAITLISGVFPPMTNIVPDKMLFFISTNMLILLPKSKGNPRAHNGLPEKCMDGDNCPVKVLENWLKRFPKSTPWSYDAALNELKKTLVKLDLKDNITLHSFQRSAATAAVEAGSTEAELDRGCRRKSSSCKKAYVQSSAKSTANVSSILRNIAK